MKVKLFATCLVDTFFPETGEATVRLLRHFGVDAEFPRDQTCCGKPPNSAGYSYEAMEAARHFLSIFNGNEPIVVPSGSCASMIKLHYPEMFRNEPNMQEKAEAVAAATFELTQFLVHKLQAHKAGFKGNGTVTYHASCQLTRELGVREEPLLLLKSVHGAEFFPLTNADRCCGFGGVFMGKLPEISMAIADEKAQAIAEIRADTVVGCDHGCLMNISDALKRRGDGTQVEHIASYLAEGL